MKKKRVSRPSISIVGKHSTMDDKYHVHYWPAGALSRNRQPQTRKFRTLSEAKDYAIKTASRRQARITVDEDL